MASSSHCNHASGKKVLVDNISIFSARQLMRLCPGSASPEAGVWCASSAVPQWHAFKHRVYEALNADALLTANALLTFDQIKTAIETDDASVFTALAALCWYHVAVCIQSSSDDGGPFFCARGLAADGRNTTIYTSSSSAAPRDRLHKVVVFAGFDGWPVIKGPLYRAGTTPPSIRRSAPVM
jgi:hypothetical protein